ncbi:hypothetical protein Plhal304r1_c043g0122801 [Plasmopara halstedii]
MIRVCTTDKLNAAAILYRLVAVFGWIAMQMKLIGGISVHFFADHGKSNVDVDVKRSRKVL